MSRFDLARSRALWNRGHLDLRSDETIAQLLDRGELDGWRELYRIARQDADLRRRIAKVVERVPLAYGHFWLAALCSLGEPVEMDRELPRAED